MVYGDVTRCKCPNFSTLQIFEGEILACMVLVAFWTAFDQPAQGVLPGFHMSWQVAKQHPES